MGEVGPVMGIIWVLICGCPDVLAHVVVVALTCHWGARFALAALFTASVEREALEHLNTHGRDVWKKKANVTTELFILKKIKAVMTRH